MDDGQNGEITGGDGGEGLDAVVLNPGSSLVYSFRAALPFNGTSTLLIVSVDGKAVIVLPELEKGKLRVVPANFRAFHLRR